MFYPGEGEVGGSPAVDNPWASYGLNPDGSPVVREQPVKGPDAAQVEMAEVKAKLATAEARLAQLPADFEGVSKKMAVVDRLVQALSGGEADPKTAEYKKIWGELKEVSRVAAPGFYKQMVRYENDPNAGDATERTTNALAQARLSDLNTNAHAKVMDLAKGVFRGLSSEELAEAVYPFEATMTEMINANPELSRRFVNGDMGVVQDMFQRLAKPHLAGRLRQKQAATRESAFPKAMPKGQSGPDSTPDTTAKRNLSTRQGREAFHKAAVGRFLDKSTQSDE